MKNVKKAVILAGGFGTRISEESVNLPKPMIQIGNKPILWHIMKIYSHYGINEFIICCGYKGYVIKEFFSNYFLHTSDVTFDMTNNKMTVHEKFSEPWKVTLVDTGENTMTGGRLKRVSQYINDNEHFCMTYGDGVANLRIDDLVKHHFDSGKKATITATLPPGRFGSLVVENQLVTSFMEKPKGDGALINGGFFVLSKDVFELIDNDSTVWEKQPLESLAADQELTFFLHDNFWQPMDTLKDKNLLEDLWNSGKAPWKVW